MKIKWEAYDPDWLVKIALEQIPIETEVINSIRKCRKGFWESRAYVYFVNPENANEPNAEWQFGQNLILKDKKKGEIVLDILKDNRLGGIEFKKYVK